MEHGILYVVIIADIWTDNELFQVRNWEVQLQFKVTGTTKVNFLTYFAVFEASCYKCNLPPGPVWGWVCLLVCKGQNDGRASLWKQGFFLR